MPSLANLVRVVSATTGTGALTLGGAVTGFLTPTQAGMVSGQSYSYAIEASYVVVGDDQVPTAREVGSGVYDSGAGTLTRNVLNSTNGNSLLNLTGDEQVIICVTTESFNPLPAQNLFINAGMMISQERVGAVLASAPGGSYIVDMLKMFTVGAQVVSIQQRSGSPERPAGFNTSARILVTTQNASPASGDYCAFSAYIEGYRAAPLQWGTSDAQSIAIGFWVRSNRPGTYSVSANNNAFNRSYATTFVYNSAGAWEYKTLVIPGDTTGTWELTSSAGIVLNIALMAGTGVSITANTWSAAGAVGVTGAVNGVAATTDYMQITGLSVLPGRVPMPQELSAVYMLSFSEELFLCQRYYEKSFDYTTAPVSNLGLSLGPVVYTAGRATTGNQDSNSIQFKAKKRVTAPTITLFNPSAANAQIRDVSAGGDCGSSAGSGYEHSFFATCTGNASTAVGNRLAFYWVADARM